MKKELINRNIEQIDKNPDSEVFNDIQVGTVFSLEDLQRKQDLFSDATGVASIITYPDGTPITRPSNFTRIFSDFLFKSDKVQDNKYHSFSIPGIGDSTIYRNQECVQDGLLYTSAIISVGEKPLAIWLIGQVRTEVMNESCLIGYANETGVNASDFLLAYKEVPVMLAWQFDKVSKMLAEFAGELSQKAFNSLQLKKQIAEHEKATVLLKEGEEKFKLLIETMPNGFYRTTPGGYYVDVNNAMVKMLGYDTKEELLRVYIPTDIYVKPEERDDFERSNEDFISDFEVYRLKTKDGRIIWIEDNARYIKDADGRTIFNEGICRDITDRKQAEAEIKLQNQELLKINTEKDKFFSIIAHDLRSPFNSFLGLTQIMAEELHGLTMDEIQKFAVSMRNSATNLFRLLENLLQWSRIQQGLIPFRQEYIQLLPIVNESIEMMLEPAKNKNIEISKDIPYHLKVFADRNILEAVVRNLISNAIKFTHKGGAVSISAKVAVGSCIEVSIKDSGIGMSQSMIGNLFRLDVQTNRKGTEDEPSTGLGLILCKDFIEKHGGRIWVNSEPGKGSVFHFSLPLPSPPANLKSINNLETPVSDDQWIGKLKILIAEDDQTSEMYMTRVVKTYSKQLITVNTGIDAVEACRAHPDIDLVLMDIQMPEMDGIKATKTIRTFNKDVIIIAQTAFAMSGDKTKAKEAGCNDYLTKPIKKDELLTMIRRFFTKTFFETK